MSDLQDECDGWREQCESNETENTELRKRLIAARDTSIGKGATTLDMLRHRHPWLGAHLDALKERHTKTLTVLADLTDHVDCATSEAEAKEVFCSGCFDAINHAVDHLEIEKPSWRNR